MGPGDLNDALKKLDIPADPNLLVGLEGSEDAGVYKINDETALVQTIDFFTPIVDDPYIFGRAAAANSLSDVYAMGGKPITAMNVVCFPTKKLGIDILTDILRGGLSILKEAGVALLGGHSVEDDEPKYGLSVTGLVRPDQVMRNAGLKSGDHLVLTKSIGTGIIATALKAGLATTEALNAMVSSICALNKTASEVAVNFDLKACTDITGFGLAGHLVEMARAGKCLIEISAKEIPVLPGALEGAVSGLIPGGAYANRKYFASWTRIDEKIPTPLTDVMFDPQTSGGLVIGVPENKLAEFTKSLDHAGIRSAKIIGKVVAQHQEGLLEVLE